VDGLRELASADKDVAKPLAWADALARRTRPDDLFTTGDYPSLGDFLAPYR
jgi:hypothetical protein